jgi:hypothetical protein
LSNLPATSTMPLDCPDCLVAVQIYTTPNVYPEHNLNRGRNFNP